MPQPYRWHDSRNNGSEARLSNRISPDDDEDSGSPISDHEFSNNYNIETPSENIYNFRNRSSLLSYEPKVPIVKIVDPSIQKAENIIQKVGLMEVREANESAMEQTNKGTIMFASQTTNNKKS